MDNKQNKNDNAEIPPPIAKTIPEMTVKVIKLINTNVKNVIRAKNAEIIKNTVNDLFGIFISF